MDMPTEGQIVQRLWSEQKYAVVARSPQAAQDISKEMAKDVPDPAAALQLISNALEGPETQLPVALEEAWNHLLPRVGMPARKAMMSVFEKSTEDARWLLAGLAEDAGDAVVASSRLFDHPAAQNRIWLRDRLGPTMYEMRRGRAVRLPPAEVGRILLEAFDETAVKTLALVAVRPRTPAEVRRLVGPAGPRVLEAASRLLILRRVAGFYRTRGMAVRLVLAGLGRT